MADFPCARYPLRGICIWDNNEANGACTDLRSDVTFSRGVFEAVETVPEGTRRERVDSAAYRYLVPGGFVDLQFNGGFGIDYSRADLCVEDVETTCCELLRFGVIEFVPTVISSSRTTYEHAIGVLLLCMERQDERLRMPFGERGQPRARILGIHLEGPFLAPERKGAHALQHLREPVEAGIDTLIATYGSVIERALDARAILIVTLAPELSGSLDLIHYLHTRGVVSSIGHTVRTMCCSAVQRWLFAELIEVCTTVQ